MGGQPMTRKSKREIERALQDLSSTEQSATDGEPIQKQYPDDIEEFVESLALDNLAYKIAPNTSNPETTRRILKHLREEYGIDENRDDAVHATLRDRAGEVQSQYWNADDVIPAAIITGPALLDEADRERFEQLLDAGDDDEAADLIVDAAYDWLADGAPQSEVSVA